MPRIPGVSVLLTDEQLWAIICADPSIKRPQLAEMVGALPGPVNSARWRLRTYGWTCRVSYGVCRSCGKPLVHQGTT